MFNLTPWRRDRGNSGELVPGGHPLEQIRDEFDALFNRFFASYPGLLPANWGGQFRWGLDVDETDKEVVVRAEAPGFEAGDFDVRLSGNVLTIRAEHKQEQGEKEKDYTYAERRLQRTVTLPPGTEGQQVEARYRNGVLELRLPRAAGAQARRIEVKS